MYSVIENTIGISEEDFTSAVFSTHEATRQIMECMCHLIMNVPELEKIAFQILEYIVLTEEYREDGGPGSGNHGHAGVPGQVGGSAPSDSSGEKGRLCSALQPKGSGYVDASSKDDFISQNVKALMPIYEDGGMEAVEAEYYNYKMQQSTTDLHEVSKDEAAETLYDSMSQSTYDGWIRNADSGYKPRIVEAITSTPEARNAALNTMYENYKFFNPDSSTSYEDFLNTPVEMYRGGHGQTHTSNDIFSSYTFNKSVAEKFAGDGGTVYTATIRPIDTYGSLATNGESEIFVPSAIAPNGNVDGADTQEQRFSTSRKNRLLSVGSLKEAYSFFSAGENTDICEKSIDKCRKQDTIKSKENHDENWITVNGTPVLLDDEGKAVGGPSTLVDGDLSKAKSESSKTKEKSGESSPKTSSKNEVGSTSEQNNRIYHFETSDGTMKITSDLPVKASKSGKTTATIKAGEEISDIYSFAGKGSDTNLVVSGLLAKQYGTDAKGWSHKAGFSTIARTNGSSEKAEVHWFEHDDIGQIKFKVKNR